jgi:AcrR family transcriptional regulator
LVASTGRKCAPVYLADQSPGWQDGRGHSVHCSEIDGMSFGKPGRPPEDRVARQIEIFRAVAPLLLERGVRGLSMPQAAHAACLSIGGLYHYFPTKRELVLYGLNHDARDRLCREYRTQLADLARWSLEQGITAYLDHSVRMFSFVRPSARAALELGMGDVQELLRVGLDHNVGDLAETIRALAPQSTPADREALSRAIRRMSLGALLDEETDFTELRGQIRLLIDGHLARTNAAPLAATA